MTSMPQINKPMKNGETDGWTAKKHNAFAFGVKVQLHTCTKSNMHYSEIINNKWLN